jgi:hypothetical protein
MGTKTTERTKVSIDTRTILLITHLLLFKRQAGLLAYKRSFWLPTEQMPCQELGWHILSGFSMRNLYPDLEVNGCKSRAVMTLPLKNTTSRAVYRG